MRDGNGQRDATDVSAINDVGCAFEGRSLGYAPNPIPCLTLGPRLSDAPPKRTEKLQIMLDQFELEAIEDWRFRNRVPSRAAAIRELIRRGLEAGDLDASPSDQSSQDFRVTDPPTD